MVALPACAGPWAVARCLQALADQRGPVGLPLAPHAFGVVIIAPGDPAGCASARIARDIKPHLPFPLLVAEDPRMATLAAVPPALRAAWTRQRAVDLAADWLTAKGQPDAALLLTEADALPAPNWIWTTLRALDVTGADAVAGEVGFAPEGDILAADPPEAEARWRDGVRRYAALLGELAAQLDPDPNDPWPHPILRSSANAALRLSAWRALGQPSATVDPFEALRRQDARLGYAPRSLVQLPACRAAAADAALAATLEPLPVAWRRLRLRATLRRLWAEGVGTARPATPALCRAARALRLTEGELTGRLGAPHFGALWAGLEQDCPAALAGPRRPMSLRRLTVDSAATEALLKGLRFLAWGRVVFGPLPGDGEGGAGAGRMERHDAGPAAPSYATRTDLA